MARPVIPLFDYLVNQDYIAEFLCINKEKTEMQCNGKCYLMQQLAKQNEQKKQNLPKIAMEEYPIGFVDLTFFETLKEDTSTNRGASNYQNFYGFLYVFENFQPPTC